MSPSFLNVALSSVSFIIAVGYIIDFLREEYFSKFTESKTISISENARKAAKDADSLLNIIFGKEILSLRFFKTAAVISFSLNFSILLIFYFYQIISDYLHGPSGVNPRNLALEDFIVYTIAPCFFAIITDCISLIVTRLLIKRFITSGNFLSLILDFFIAIALLSINRATLAFGFDIAFDTLLDSLGLRSRPFGFIQENWINIILWNKPGIGYPRFLICSLSVLLPSWIYIVLVFEKYFFWTFQETRAVIWLRLAKGGKHRYTRLFTVIAVLLCFLAIPVDLYLSQSP